MRRGNGALRRCHCSRIGAMQATGAFWSRLVLAIAGAALFLPGLAGPARAQTLLPLSAEEARHVLGSEDEFTRRMSAFDRAARMKTDRPVSMADYLAFAASDARDWTPEEKSRLLAAYEGIRPAIAASGLPLPEVVQVIKTAGTESLDAAYTRGTTIVFPGMLLGFPEKALQVLVAHEIFHVASRAHPELAHRLYKAVGFEHCGELRLPEPLARRRITNPDAPTSEYCIEVQVEGRMQWVMPVLLGRTETYEPLQGGEYLDYLQFRLVAVDRPEEGASHSVAANPRLLQLGEVTGYYERVGRNTRYVIHPEEIVADNFAMLVTGVEQIPSPEILARVREVIASAKAVQ